MAHRPSDSEGHAHESCVQTGDRGSPSVPNRRSTTAAARLVRS